MGDAESAMIEVNFSDAGHGDHDGPQADETRRIEVELEVSWRVTRLAPWVGRVRNAAS